MTDVDTILDHSRRFQTFRKELIRIIPRLPNDKASLKALQSKRHADLLIIYMCWRLRHIAIRPRTVIGRSVLDDDPRADTLRPNIEAFISMVENGSDLGPYLSLKARRFLSRIVSDSRRMAREIFHESTGKPQGLREP